MNSLTYIIIDIENITDEMYLAGNNNADNIRKSLDGSKGILKFKGEKPSCFEGIDTYSHKEILTIINDKEWQENGLG